MHLSHRDGGVPGPADHLRAARPSAGPSTRAQLRYLAYVDRLAALLERCGDPKRIARRFERIVLEAGYDPWHLNLSLRRGATAAPSCRTARRSAWR